MITKIALKDQSDTQLLNSAAVLGLLVGGVEYRTVLREVANRGLSEAHRPSCRPIRQMDDNEFARLVAILRMNGQVGFANGLLADLRTTLGIKAADSIVEYEFSRIVE